MRPYILPLAGCIMIIVGVVLVLSNPGSAPAAGIALALQIAGVASLGFFIIRNLGGRRGPK